MDTVGSTNIREMERDVDRAVELAEGAIIEATTAIDKAVSHLGGAIENGSAYGDNVAAAMGHIQVAREKLNSLPHGA